MLIGGRQVQKRGFGSKCVFFPKSVKLKVFFFFANMFFFPMKAQFGLTRVLCPISSATSCKEQIIFTLESVLIVFILYIHLSLGVNFFI